MTATSAPFSARRALRGCTALMTASLLGLGLLVGAVSATPLFQAENTHLTPARLAEVEAMMAAR